MDTEVIPEIQPSTSKIPVDQPNQERNYGNHRSQNRKNRNHKDQQINDIRSKIKQKSIMSSIQKIFIPQVSVIQEEKLSLYTRDLLLYNIPASWTKEEILNHLTSWGKVLTLSIKSQRNTKRYIYA